MLRGQRSWPAAVTGSLALWLTVAMPLYGQTIDPDREIVLLTTTDPLFEFPSPIFDWNPATPAVWRAALRHPESELRREVADMIRQAHRYGLDGLESLHEPLLEVLQDPEELPLTKLSVAKTLIALDVVDSAPQLDALVDDGSPLLQATIDQGLARWGYTPARARLRELLSRLDADPQLVQAAIRSLADAGDLQSLESLEEILFSPQRSSPIRLEAARAVGRLQPEQAVAWAERLGGADGSSRQAQLAVELLSEADSVEAIALLDALADHDGPTIAAAALRQLSRIDPPKVLSRAQRLVEHRDANVRKVVIETLGRHPSPSSVEMLSLALGDPVPELRRQARRRLLHQAGDETLRPSVVQRATERVAAEDWRAIEQAIMVLVELEGRGANDRLLEWLDFPRDEVQLAAAFALKHLLPEDRTEELHAAARRISEQIADGQTDPARSRVLAHLLEGLAVRVHRPAVDLLTRLVPKSSPYPVESRAAAVWSLGHLLEPQTDRRLISSLQQRLADADSDEPEADEVRAAAAIALGRIGDGESLDELRRWYRVESAESLVGRSCGWAIEQMTGEPLPPPQTVRLRIGTWSVTPMTDQGYAAGTQ